MREQVQIVLFAAGAALALTAVSIAGGLVVDHIEANLDRIELDGKQAETTLADARRQVDDARQKLAVCDARLRQAGFYADGAP